MENKKDFGSEAACFCRDRVLRRSAYVRTQRSSEKDTSSFGRRVREFGSLPERFHLRSWDVGESGALFSRHAFHFPEATREFLAGFFQRELRIDFEEAGEIDRGEEDIPHLGFDIGGRLLGLQGRTKFRSFFFQFRKDTFGGIPIESYASRLAR